MDTFLDVAFSMGIQNIQNMSCLKWIARSIENNDKCEQQALTGISSMSFALGI